MAGRPAPDRIPRTMQIRELTAIHARIALKKQVTHASFSRTENDTLLIRCLLDDGTIGWGEGLPRPYVTGETIDTAWQHLAELDRSPLKRTIGSAEELREVSDGFRFSRPAEMRDCFGNVVRCALELSLLDAWCRTQGISLATYLRRLADADGLTHDVTSVRYSAAVTGSSITKVRLRSLLFRLGGFEQCKVKVGFGDAEDRRIVGAVRSFMGRRCRIRIDANEAWQPDELARRLHNFDGLGIVSVEQPVPHAVVDRLATVRRDCPIPIMFDESLCSLTDGQRAIDLGLCDAFNIRLSKCGGPLESVRLVRMAANAGLTCQLGCQVGETGILSAAGRHFASAIRGLTAVEGSFDRFLVRDRLTREDLTFGYGGRAPAISLPGLGVTVDEQAVGRVTVRTMQLIGP